MYGGWREPSYPSGELTGDRKGVYVRFSLHQGLAPCPKHLSMWGEAGTGLAPLTSHSGASLEGSWGPEGRDLPKFPHL